jgi:hypothetical protein
LHVLIVIDNKIFGKYSWLYVVFTHVSLGIFYFLVLSRSVTVPLCGWDRGTFSFTSGPSGRTGRLWAVPTDQHWRPLLVARLLATAALWVRIRTSLKNTKYGHRSSPLTKIYKINCRPEQFRQLINVAYSWKNTIFLTRYLSLILRKLINTYRFVFFTFSGI